MADRPTLTDAQRKALRTDRNLSVTAGAGSGKTTLLVERYLKILLEEREAGQPLGIRQVLAITFTEKATAEMTERVARMLQQRLDAARTPAERAPLLALRERLNSAQISTIHGFCSRILREFAVASAVDPDFTMLSEFQQDLLMRESIEETISGIDRREMTLGFDEDAWRELFRQVPVYRLREILLDVLRQPWEMRGFRRRLAESDDEALHDDLTRAFLSDLDRAVNRAALLVAADPLLRALDALHPDLDTLGDKAPRFFDAVHRAAGRGIADPDDPELWRQLLILTDLLCTDGRAKTRVPSIGNKGPLGDAWPLLKDLAEILAIVSDYMTTGFAAAPGDLDRLHFRILRRLAALYGEASDRYAMRKEERGALDFEDLQIQALDMLQTHPEVVEKLRKRYRFVMVDEFQDTNFLQWAIISHLGMDDGGLDSGKFFVVGDPKQSIYGFRNADVRVFESVKETFGAEDRDNNLLLEESFRFLPDLNRFVNSAFRRILGTVPETEFDVRYDDLATRRSVTGNAAIEVGLFDRVHLEERGLSEEDYIAQRIAALLNGGEQVWRRSGDGEALDALRPGDIAILLQRRTRLLDLESTLRRYDIPFRTVGGVGFYRRQEVFDVYHLLRYLHNPADDLALVGILRSPLAGVSDEGLYYLSLESGRTYRERLTHVAGSTRPYPELDRSQLELFETQLGRWERRRDRLPLARLLAEIFEESGYRAVVATELNGDQYLANLDKLVEMARDYEQGGFAALADFIESLHQIIHFEPREGEAQIALEDDQTVKIMTIHQAKGLEFPIVFYPYLAQVRRGSTAPHRLDGELGLAVKLRDPQAGFQEARPFLFEWIDRRLGEREIAEYKRLFYVGVTRARDRVFLSAAHRSQERGKDNPLTWLADALELDVEAPPEVEYIHIDGDLPVRLVTDLDAPPGTRAAGRDIEARLEPVEKTLADSDPEAEVIPPGMMPLRAVPEGVTFSATQLLTFVRDPEAYFRRYHLGFFESDYEFVREASDPTHVALLKGKIVHKLLETGLPESPAAMDDRLEQAFFHYEVFDPELQKEMKEEIPDLIRRLGDSDFARQVFAPAEWKAEISLTMKLGKDFFTGTLDRIFRNGEGIWEVVDYKTNRVSAARVAATGADYHMQMESYALLIARLFPGQPRYPVSLYFLFPGVPYQQVYSPRDIERIETRFTGLIEDIRQYYPFGTKLG